MLRQRPSTSISSKSDHGDQDEDVTYRKVSLTKLTIKQSPSAVIKKVIKRTLITAIIFILFLYGACPLIFRGSLFIRRNMLFMNWLNLPLYKNLSNPELEYGMNCTRNLYITNNEGLTIGIWHVLPKSQLHRCNLNDPMKLDASEAFNDERPIVFYAHGNGGARGGNHRRELYKVLAYNDQLDYHVVAFDYRGYGDSSDVTPTVPGVVSDAATAYFWLLDQTKNANGRIVVWGHSLGTAISSQFVSSLQTRDQPAGLLLESPFNTIGDAVSLHPFTATFRWLPHFRWAFVDPVVNDPNSNFDSESRMRDIRCAILILHAMDDKIVPYPLGVKLYRMALESRPKDVPVAKMVSFAADHKYGHKDICRDPEIPKIIADFVGSCIQAAPVSVST
ncbi:Lysophosphatidylserine lipase ABHD12 [Halotydeus destructor]|nr:Lysophosphatidylserine lipase ABHD12 [Halotydeus destructor]